MLVLVLGLSAGAPACFAPASLQQPARPFTGDPAPQMATRSRYWPMPQSYWPMPQPYWPPPEQQPYAYPMAPGVAPPLGAGVAVMGAAEPAHPTDGRPVPELVTPTTATAPSPSEPPQLLPTSVLEESGLLAALRFFLEKNDDKGRQALQDMDPQTQEILLTLLPLTVRMNENGVGKADPQELAVVIDRLQSVLWKLRPRAALVMDKFCFCHLVRGFGRIDALDEKPTFVGGEMVEVYAEIRNISSQPHRSRRGDFRTHLVSKLDLRRPGGESVWDGPKEIDKPDETMTPQHDYFQHYSFRMPALPPGEYVLDLEVTDVPTGRTVRQQLNFTIAAPGVMAGGQG
jgi:hypothetical protein